MEPRHRTEGAQPQLNWIALMGVKKCCKFRVIASVFDCKKSALK